MELTDSYTIPLIIALVEVIKRAGLNPRWLPVCAIGLGLVWSYFTGADYFQGLIAGLASIGLFSGVKATNGK